MPFPRVIIADTDVAYTSRLQKKFVDEFFGRIELEIITDPAYFDQLFAMPQEADVLIISDGLYSPALQRHSIGSLFLLTEQQDGPSTGLNVVRIAKYSSIGAILNEIVSKNPDLQNKARKKDCQIVAVTSACGGVGKTTIALGICGCLAREYKRVLYINAGRLQSFQRVMQDHSPITAPDVYAKLAHSPESVYEEIRHFVRKERFSYLPPFKASLLSLNLPFSIFEKLVLSARKSHDFDYIVVDMDAAFDEECAALLGDADKVLIVTRQSAASAYATNMLVSSLDHPDEEKYLFVCGDFRADQPSVFSEQDMMLRFSVNEFVEHFEDYDTLACEEYADNTGIRKMSMLIL